MGNLYNLKKGVATQDDLLTAPDYITVVSADGAIAIQSGTVVITKGTAAALTIASPTAAQDGTIIRIVSATAAAHTVTYGTVGFNDGGTASDVGTFAAAKGNGFAIVAYNTKWYVLYNTNVTLA